MNKQLIKQGSVMLALLFNVMIVHAQAIPSYVQQINYSVDIGHLNDGGISILPNDLLIDYGDGVAPSGSISPTVIRDIRGAIVDGFHYEVDGTKYFSFDVDTRVNGASVLKSDIIRCNDFNCTTFGYFFDSVAQNLQHININAFTFDVENGDLIFSIDGPATIGSLGVVAADMVRYDGSVFSLEYDSSSSIDGIGVYKNINAISMMSTGEYGISLENDGDYKDEFNYDNHWILSYAPSNRTWRWFYTILSFGEFENPLKLTSLMIRENDLIFRNGFD
ncbi:hypothetical protein [Marinicella litoralis]|uniref:Uncharacterized protein n=1 Tax=Marinicella litoralis TaxID=644220 RepID=A0A4R6XNY1_9GAMM|nr:hypothetical protein [Marinicella litoralis]TDR19447.1 hypothetical protein C8D91_2003 [Marinicella litoralis]